METVIYFSPANRRYTLDVLRVYTDGFSRRVLSGFNEIEVEAEAAARAFYDEQMNRVCGYDGPDEDAASVAEEAYEQSLNVYMDLEFVRRQVTGLAIAGLYHFWEKLVKDFLVLEFNHFGPPPVAEPSVRRADFDKLLDILAQQGWEVRQEDFYHDLDTLRLVANVVKHGDGASCSSLLAKVPDLFMDFGHEFLNKSRGADELRVNSDHFVRLGMAARSFFETFPERLPR